MPETLLRKGSVLLIQGIDISVPAEYIGEQFLRESENFTVDRGLITKRTGTSSRGAVVGGSGDDVRVMGGAELTRSGTKYNVRVGRAKIENWTTVWNDITGVDLTGGDDDLIDFAIPLLSGNEILCITNGVDNIRKWTGSGNTADLGGTPPVAKYIEAFRTYLVCANIAGGTDVPQRVQWSDTADPETWSGGNSGSVDLVTENSERITGLKAFGNYITVHTRREIYLGYLVNTDDIFKFDRKPTGAGTIANATIQNLPNNTQVFLAEDGLRLFDGVTTRLIDDRLNDEIRDGLNQEFAGRAWSVLFRHKDEVQFGIPIGNQEVGETVYKYNYKTGAIYKDSRPNVNAAWIASSSDASSWDDQTGTWDEQTERWNSGQLGQESGEIHYGDTSGNTVIVDSGVADDNGTAVDAFFITKDYRIDDIGRLSRWQEILIWAKGSGSLHVDYSTDGGSSWSTASGSPFTLGSEFPTASSPMRGYFDTVSELIRFRFRVDGSEETLSVKQFLVGFTQREQI